MYTVVIPTKGRAGHMLCMKKVVPELLQAGAEVHLVVEPQEVEQYASAYLADPSELEGLRILALPMNDQNIAYARRYLQQKFSDRTYLMIDDDCEGFSRRSGELTASGNHRLVSCKAPEAMEHLLAKAQEHGIACCSHRPQNWFIKDPPGTMLMWNTVCVSPALGEKGVWYDPNTSCFEDYEITAQALRAGFTPYMSPLYAFNTSVAIGVLPGGIQCFDRVAVQDRSIAHILKKWNSEALLPTDPVKIVVNKKSGRREIRFRWKRIPRGVL